MGRTGANDWTAFRPNAMIGWLTCLSVYHLLGSSQAARSCVLEEGLSRKRGGIFLAQIYRLAKLDNPAFKVIS